jgi:hypothetical protein
VYEYAFMFLETVDDETFNWVIVVLSKDVNELMD